MMNKADTIPVYGRHYFLLTKYTLLLSQPPLQFRVLSTQLPPSSRMEGLLSH